MRCALFPGPDVSHPRNAAPAVSLAPPVVRRLWPLRSHNHHRPRRRCQDVALREVGTPHDRWFGRGCEKLGVELICAHRPQDKGRVEQRNVVFQYRLVMEPRLRDIRSMEQANAFLEGVFLDNCHPRFGRPGQSIGYLL
jgi:hypothetical protein